MGAVLVSGTEPTELPVRTKELELKAPLRITLVGPPIGVAFCLLAKDSDLIHPVVSTGHDISFEFIMRATNAASGVARFLGPYAYGPPKSRFIYIGVGTFAGQQSSCWSRRAKIGLSDISWHMIEEASDRKATVEAFVRGGSKERGPLCGTVALLSAGWQLSNV